MVPVNINISVYDFETNLLKTFATCRYLKVTKNSLISKKAPFYNQYQFMLEVPVNDIQYIKENNIFGIEVLTSEGTSFKTFIMPKIIEVVMETEISTQFNIIGISLNIKRFLNEEILCRVSDYDKFFKAFDIPRPPFSTSIYGFMEEGMFNIIDLFYGPVIKESSINDKYINHNTLTIQNLPIMNNYDVILYYFEKFYPVLDFPFFAIDDFFPFLDTTTIEGNYTSKLILNSFQNILENQNQILIKQANNFRPYTMFEIKDIDKSLIYKFAYGDYIVHDVDHPMVQDGPIFNMPRVFGKKIKLDRLKSIHTVFFDYPIDKLSLDAIRSNYEKLIGKSMLTTMIGFLNAPLSFFEINRILPIDDLKFYIYGGEYEFAPLTKKGSGKTEFKINCILKTLDITQ